MTGEGERRRRFVTAALAAPASLWLLVFLILPFFAMLVFAFGRRAPAGGYQPDFTFEQFLTANGGKVDGVLGTLTYIAFRAYSSHDLEQAFDLGLEG